MERNSPPLEEDDDGFALVEGEQEVKRENEQNEKLQEEKEEENNNASNNDDGEEHQHQQHQQHQQQQDVAEEEEDGGEEGDNQDQAEDPFDEETLSLHRHLRLIVHESLESGGILPTEEEKQSILIECVQRGVPPELRPILWQLLTFQHRRTRSKTSSNNEATLFSELQEKETLFHDLLAQIRNGHASAALDDIAKDLHRTFPSLAPYKTREGQLVLGDVLSAYSIHNSHVGYCQSMNFVAALLLVTLEMKPEVTFYLLSHIVEDILPPDYYSASLTGFQVDVLVLESLAMRYLPTIKDKLDETGVSLSFLCPSWFLCLFSNSLPFFLVRRVWDRIFLDGSVVLFRIALAALARAFEPKGRRRRKRAGYFEHKYQQQQQHQQQQAAAREKEEEERKKKKQLETSTAAETNNENSAEKNEEEGEKGNSTEEETTTTTTAATNEEKEEKNSSSSETNITNNEQQQQQQQQDDFEQINPEEEEFDDYDDGEPINPEDEEEEEVMGPELVRKIVGMLKTKEFATSVVALANTQFLAITEEEVNELRDEHLATVKAEQERIRQLKLAQEMERRNNVIKLQSVVVGVQQVYLRLQNPSFSSLRQSRMIPQSVLIKQCESLLKALLASHTALLDDIRSDEEQAMLSAAINRTESNAQNLTEDERLSQLFASGAVFEEESLLRSLIEDLSHLKQSLPAFLGTVDTMPDERPTPPVVVQFIADSSELISRKIEDISTALSVSANRPPSPPPVRVSRVNALFDRLLADLHGAIDGVPARSYCEELITEIGLTAAINSGQLPPNYNNNNGENNNNNNSNGSSSAMSMLVAAPTNLILNPMQQAISSGSLSVKSTFESVTSGVGGLLGMGGGGGGGGGGKNNKLAANDSKNRTNNNNNNSGTISQTTTTPTPNKKENTDITLSPTLSPLTASPPPPVDANEVRNLLKALLLFQKLRRENAAVRFPDILAGAPRMMISGLLEDCRCDLENRVRTKCPVPWDTVRTAADSIIAKWCRQPSERLFFSAVGFRIRNLHHNQTTLAPSSSSPSPWPVWSAAAPSPHSIAAGRLNVPTGGTNSPRRNDSESVRAKGAPPLGELWVVVWHNYEIVRNLSRLVPAAKTLTNLLAILLEELKQIETEIQTKKAIDALLAELEKLQAVYKATPNRYVAEQCLTHLFAVKPKAESFPKGEWRERLLDAINDMEKKLVTAISVDVGDGAENIVLL